MATSRALAAKDAKIAQLRGLVDTIRRHPEDAAELIRDAALGSPAPVAESDTSTQKAEIEQQIKQMGLNDSMTRAALESIDGMMRDEEAEEEAARRLRQSHANDPERGELTRIP